jgi:hypothetical protein
MCSYHFKIRMVNNTLPLRVGPLGLISKARMLLLLEVFLSCLQEGTLSPGLLFTSGFLASSFLLVPLLDL